MKRYGKDRNPNQEQIDTAIAYHAPAEDRAKILIHSPTAQALNSKKKTIALQEYLLRINTLTKKLEDKLLIQSPKEGRITV